MDLPVVADSVTKVPSDVVNRVLVAASHSGVFAALEGARKGASALILNDAGGGLDDAGLSGLDYLESYGMPCAAVGHMTARIGDGDDMLRRGRITAANDSARALGVEIGMSVPEAATRLSKSTYRNNIRFNGSEGRFVLAGKSEDREVVIADSASLVTDSDTGRIVITGSHGGLLGGNSASAIRAPVYAAFYNDAGIGIDEAGISRLPILQDAGIAAGTVDANTARIGDASSSYKTGIISRLNDRARELGGKEGMALHEFIEMLRSQGGK